MSKKLLFWLLRIYFGGKQKSWLIVSVVALMLRVGKSLFGRSESVDLSKVKPGQRLVIEHLSTTHKADIRKGRKPKRGSLRTDLSVWNARERNS